MADSFTPHYNLVLPTPGSDTNTWGGLLNGNTSAIDTAIYNAQQTASAAFPAAGGNLTGSIIQTQANNVIYRMIDSAQTAPAGRWQIVDGGNQFMIERNTASAGDFSATTTPFSLSATDVATFAGGMATASLGVTNGLSVGGTVNLNDTNAGSIVMASRPVFAGNTPWDSGNLPSPVTGTGVTLALGWNASPPRVNFTVNGSGGQYMATSWPNAVSFDWSQHATGQLGLTVDTTYQGYLWHSGNFNPGNYPTLAYANAAYVQLSTQNWFRTDSQHTYEALWDAGAGHLNFTVDGNLIGYIVSDERAKENIAPTTVDSLARINAVDFVSFDYRDEPFLPRGHVDVGVIAQRVEHINPRWVRHNGENGYDGLNTEFMLLDALHALQQVSARVAQLEAAQH